MNTHPNAYRMEAADLRTQASQLNAQADALEAHANAIDPPTPAKKTKAQPSASKPTRKRDNKGHFVKQ